MPTTRYFLCLKLSDLANLGLLRNLAGQQNMLLLFPSLPSTKQRPTKCSVSPMALCCITLAVAATAASHSKIIFNVELDCSEMQLVFYHTLRPGSNSSTPPVDFRSTLSTAPQFGSFGKSNNCFKNKPWPTTSMLFSGRFCNHSQNCVARF